MDIGLLSLFQGIFSAIQHWLGIKSKSKAVTKISTEKLKTDIEKITGKKIHIKDKE